MDASCNTWLLLAHRAVASVTFNHLALWLINDNSRLVGQWGGARRLAPLSAKQSQQVDTTAHSAVCQSAATAVVVVDVVVVGVVVAAAVAGSAISSWQANSFVSLSIVLAGATKSFGSACAAAKTGSWQRANRRPLLAQFCMKPTPEANENSAGSANLAGKLARARHQDRDTWALLAGL